MSDGENKSPKKKFDDFGSSAIHSDDLSSFCSEFKHNTLKVGDKNNVDFTPVDKSNAGNSGLGRPPLPGVGAKKSIRRIQTTDFKNNDPMN